MKINQEFETRYTRLNQKQRQAVDTIFGPVMVIAGPGSGKTELLSMRVANILRETDTLASSILCLTFTEAAATNMRERLTDVIGRDAYKVAIHTFHSFANEVINQNPEFFFFGASFSTLDEMMKLDIIDSLLSKLPKDNVLASYQESVGWTFRSSIISGISDLKQEGFSPDDFSTILDQNERFLENTNELFSDFFEDRITKETVLQLPLLLDSLQQFVEPKIGKYESLGEYYIKKLLAVWDQCQEHEKTTPPLSLFKKSYITKTDSGKNQLKDVKTNLKNIELCKIYQAYQNELWSQGLFDFDDMLLEVNKVLASKPELALNLQERFQFVLVDEFQDTNGVQLKLVQNLVNNPSYRGRPNIMVVGDDDQAIFKFQGANVKHMFDFQQMFVDVQVITLGTNYRSGQKILDLATEVIAQSEERLGSQSGLEKEIVAFAVKPETIVSYHDLPTSEEELVWVALETQRLIQSGVSPKEIAVIARTHAPLAQLVEIMYAHNISISYERGQDVFNQEHIVSLLTVLRYVNSLFCSENEPELDDLLPIILNLDFWICLLIVYTSSA